MGAPFTAVSASHLSRDNYNNLVLIFQCLSCHLARIFKASIFPRLILKARNFSASVPFGPELSMFCAIDW
jgi:hypothetical protein